MIITLIFFSNLTVFIRTPKQICKNTVVLGISVLVLILINLLFILWNNIFCGFCQFVVLFLSIFSYSNYIEVVLEEC